MKLPPRRIATATGSCDWPEAEELPEDSSVVLGMNSFVLSGMYWKSGVEDYPWPQHSDVWFAIVVLP